MDKNRYLYINSSYQWIQHNKHAEPHPVLLVIDGGFYQPDIHQLLRNQLKKIYGLTVVTWDQPGLGHSKNAVKNWADIDIADYTSDLISLVRQLLTHFCTDKIFLLGHCFGTIPGLLAVHQHPEFFHGYFSVSQVVNPLENIKASQKKILNISSEQGNLPQVHELEKWEILSGSSDSKRKIRHNAKVAYKMDPTASSLNAFTIIGILLQMKNNPLKTWHYRTGSNKRRRHLHSDLMDINFSETVQELCVPVHFLVGRQDKISPPELTENYFRKLNAPHKTFIWFEKSGHFPFLQEPNKFKNVLKKEMALPAEKAEEKTSPIWNMVMSLC
jgi:pimeloyl-ACP methyl ester carboxylesterase